MPTTTPDIIFLALPFILIAVLFYMQKKKADKQRNFIESVRENDRVVTMGGLIGRVEQIKKDIVVLRVDEKTKVEVVKNSLYQYYETAVKNDK